MTCGQRSSIKSMLACFIEVLSNACVFCRPKIIITLILLVGSLHAKNNTDLLIFSFDCPLQLYALLESLEKYVIGIDEISLLYRVSSAEFSQAYEHCLKCFDGLKINAFKQSDSLSE